MDSSIPPPPSLGLRKLRPWYLVPAMVLTWCVGVRDLMSGLSGILFLRGGLLPDVAGAVRNAESSGDMPELMALFNAAALEAMYRFERVTFPLSVAQLLLGGLLVIASGMAMGGRRGARSLAIQALVANAALAGLAYALTRGVRGAAIDAVVAISWAIPTDMPPMTVLQRREVLWWSGRIAVAGELGALLLGALALTRSRTKVYFDATARAAESTGEP